jgi:glycine cleavage system regulatory protein
LRFLSSKNLIINAVGSDRTGIVSDMTKHVIDVGGNVGESKAARLGKYFSVMMVVSVPEEQVSKLNDQLDTMDDLNATVFETFDDDDGSDVVSTVNPAIACACIWIGLFEVETFSSPHTSHFPI